LQNVALFAVLEKAKLISISWLEPLAGAERAGIAVGITFYFPAGRLAYSRQKLLM
jgi:hypothetical protein